MDKKRNTKSEPQTAETRTPFDISLVLGYLAVKDLSTVEDKVGVLDRLGYGNQEIARICHTTPLTVAVRKAGLKKKNKKRR